MTLTSTLFALAGAVKEMVNIREILIEKGDSYSTSALLLRLVGAAAAFGLGLWCVGKYMMLLLW